MEFQLSYFKSWKMMLWKCCTQYASKNSAVVTGLEKVSFHSNAKKGSAKKGSNYPTIALISHINKVMLKILQDRLQKHVNWELPDAQARFRKGRGTRDQIANIWWIIEKAGEFQKKHLFLLSWLCQSLWLCGLQETVENSEKMGISDHLTCLLRNLYAGQEATV